MSVLELVLGPLITLAIGLITIFSVGMAGRRREAEVQLNHAHHELTSERTDAARDRLFRQNRNGTQLIGDYGNDAHRAINDYFTLMYAVEAAAVAVNAFCSTKPLRYGVKYVRGVLPRGRAEFLAWHLKAIKSTVDTFRAGTLATRPQPIGISKLDDANVHATLKEHCDTLKRYGLLDP